MVQHEDVLKVLEGKSERAELDVLRQDVAQRAHKSDLDVITAKLQNLKTEQD